MAIGWQPHVKRTGRLIVVATGKGPLWITHVVVGGGARNNSRCLFRFNFLLLVLLVDSNDALAVFFALLLQLFVAQLQICYLFLKV